MPTVTKCRCDCSPSNIRRAIKENIFLIAILTSVFLGIILGLGIRQLHPSQQAITWIGIWGELFLRMLKMVTLPLIMCCLVVGVGSMESSASGKLGAMTLAYIYITQVIAVLLGLILTLAIKPGAGFNDQLPEGVTMTDTSYTDVFADLLRNLVPENIIQACTQTIYTDIKTVTSTTYKGENSSTIMWNGADNITETLETTRKLMYRDGMNIMGIIVFSLLLGVALATMGQAGRPLYTLFVSMNDAIMVMMKVIIWYSPIGILSLISAALLKVDDLHTALVSVGLLVLTVFVGCMIHQMIILPALMAVICRKNPFKFFLGIFDAYLAGMVPCSSAAAMPYLLRACPDKLGIDRRVAQFVIPLVTSLNRDGSGIFITATAIFIAQTYSVSLGAAQLFMLVLLVSILVAATSVIPSGSIVVLIMMSNVINIPVEERLGLLMAVEWLNDRIRSGTNIVSHGYGCAIVNTIATRYIPELSSPSSGTNSPVETDNSTRVCLIYPPEEAEKDVIEEKLTDL